MSFVILYVCVDCACVYVGMHVHVCDHVCMYLCMYVSMWGWVGVGLGG